MEQGQLINTIKGNIFQKYCILNVSEDKVLIPGTITQ